VRRLLADIVPVVVEDGVVDRALPSSLVYGDGRMDAVQDLLTHLDAVYRMSGDGSLRVLPSVLGAPVWTIEGGEDGALVDVARVLSDQGVYNAVISRGTTASGDPLVGRAVVTSGPLVWGVDQPYGRVPAFHQSIAQAAAGVQADAATRLASLQAAGQIDLPVECLAHPGIQVHDAVVVVAATLDGDAPLIGRVSVEELEAVAARVAGRRG
jgi:hypothetical protein